MREVDMIWTKSRKKFPIGSYLIRFWVTIFRLLKTGKFELEDNSHCAIRFSSHIFSSPTYYQASEGLINYMSGIQFDKKHEFVKGIRISITDELYTELRDECHKEAGAPYGFMQNIGILLTDIIDLFGYEIDNPWKDGRNCSELLYTKIIIKMIGVQEYSKDKIRPDQLFNLSIKNLSKLNGRIIMK
jgi:hypothetical protein